MAIYGTALLSACLLIGLMLGTGLGHLIGVEANVGGVGIAMLLLILACARAAAVRASQTTKCRRHPVLERDLHSYRCRNGR